MIFKLYVEFSFKLVILSTIYEEKSLSQSYLPRQLQRSLREIQIPNGARKKEALMYMVQLLQRKRNRRWQLSHFPAKKSAVKLYLKPVKVLLIQVFRDWVRSLNWLDFIQSMYSINCIKLFLAWISNMYVTYKTSLWYQKHGSIVTKD